MTARQMAEAERLWRQGLTISAIAEETGINRNTLVSTIQKHRDIFPNRNHHADGWRERLALVDGLKVSEAARELGVSRDTIWKWRTELDRS